MLEDEMYTPVKTNKQTKKTINFIFGIICENKVQGKPKPYLS